MNGLPLASLELLNSNNQLANLSEGSMATISMENNNSESWRRDYPFDSNFFQTAKGRIHFVDQGSGDPVIFVHGNPTWSFYYRRLIQSLSPTHRTIAIDNLGCGLSDKPEDGNYSLDGHIDILADLIEKLQIENGTLIAHDWGGAIGLGALLKHRSCFKNIVLFNTAAFPPPYIPWRIRACRIPVLGKLGVQGLNMFARAAIKMATTRKGGLETNVANGLLAPYNNWANRKAIYHFVKDIPTRSSQKTWQTLQEIESKLGGLVDKRKCLIWGMQDWCFRPECLERFESHWPNAEVTRIDSAGHYVVEDAPEKVWKVVEQFLGS